MFRVYLVLAVLVAGLGLLSGCNSCPSERPPLFWRLRGMGADNGAQAVASEGPILSDPNPPVGPPPRPVMGNPQPTATNCAPAPAPVPRLVPQPQPQAQTQPYVPR